MVEKPIELKSESGEGHDEPEVESQEQLDSAYKKLKDLSGDGTLMVTMSKQDLSLMKQILTAASEEYKQQIMWRMCDFIDEDEALDHVAAYYEAKDLGMDTGFNVAYMFALVSSNRKTSHTNLIAQILDALQHGKWAPNLKRGNGDGHNPRSPLS